MSLNICSEQIILKLQFCRAFKVIILSSFFFSVANPVTVIVSLTISVVALR